MTKIHEEDPGGDDDGQFQWLGDLVLAGDTVVGHLLESRVAFRRSADCCMVPVL